jgi:hypothetical protein
VLVEGISSVVFVGYTLLSSRAQSRALSGAHVKYDSQLGWVSVPNFFAENYYAPGAYLKTNSRGFRADRETSDRVPPGKFRAICSGDSETFGDGVGNDQAWCQVLESLDKRFESVNMGEIGYGMDQMYLRYKRGSAGLDRDVHLFAFVTDNFRRMHYTAMGGYGKPKLKIENGELTADRVTVPKGSALAHFLALKPNPLRQFRFVTVAADLMDRIKARRPMAPEVPTDEERRLVLKLIDDLAAMEKSKNSVLALVYLPTRHDDYAPGGFSDLWRQFLKIESAKRGVAFLDLVEDFFSLPVITKDGMFIWPGFTEYFAESPGHFDIQGHAYIARQVHTKLLAFPAIAARLVELDAGAHRDGHGAGSESGSLRAGSLR